MRALRPPGREIDEFGSPKFGRFHPRINRSSPVPMPSAGIGLARPKSIWPQPIDGPDRVVILNDQITPIYKIDARALVTSAGGAARKGPESDSAVSPRIASS